MGQEVSGAGSRGAGRPYFPRAISLGQNVVGQKFVRQEVGHQLKRAISNGRLLSLSESFLQNAVKR